MTIAAWAKLFYEIFKLIPKFEEWIDALHNFHVQSKITGIENRAIDKSTKKAVIRQKISEAKSHEERAVLYSTLNDLDKL